LSRADVALIEQAQRLFANHLPLLAQHIQLGEALEVDEGSRGYRREHVHQSVVRRHQRGVVADLTPQLESDAAAEMGVTGSADEQQRDGDLDEIPGAHGT
jgi:hypothetical protein